MNGSLCPHNLSEEHTSYSDGGQLPSEQETYERRPTKASSRLNGVGGLQKRLLYLCINTTYI